MFKRQIFIDTETTGLNYKTGHRIIEFAAIEMINRKITNNFLHFYFKPNILIDKNAFLIHGISNKFLLDKPTFDLKVYDIINFIKDSELVVHNAEFDVNFLNWEISLIKNSNLLKIENYCSVLDTLVLARSLYPRSKNNLDALCKRFNINNNDRKLHGALLDAQLLSEVYLSLTGGQVNINFSDYDNIDCERICHRKKNDYSFLLKYHVSSKNLKLHEQYLKMIKTKSCQYK